MITQRALLFGFVGFCFYLIAIVNALPPFYYALTWLTAGVLVSCLGIALLSLLGIDCKWSVPDVCMPEHLKDDHESVLSQSLTAGENANSAADGLGVEISLYNGGSFNKSDVVIEVHLRSVPGEARLTRRFLLETLPSGNRITTTLPLFDLPRGRYRVEELRLIGSDVLGLFRFRKRLRHQPSGEASAQDIDAEVAVTEDSEIVISPALVGSISNYDGRQSAGGTDGVTSGATLGQGDELRGTRPYVAGDDLRFVHWKSTARRGELVVREFHHPAQNQTAVLWDGGWNQFPHSGAAEFSLRVAASLCHTILCSSQPCGLLRLDSQPVWVPPPGHGIGVESTLRHIMEVLADATLQREQSLSAALSASWQYLTPGTQLFFVSGATDELPLVAQSLRARRHEVTVALIDASRLGTISKFAPVNLIQSTLQGAKQPSVAEYDAAEQSLREKGVSTIRIPESEKPESASTSEALLLRQAMHELLQRPNSATLQVNRWG
jgi:uncharacterized protein (DUF58 family)